MTIIVIANQKGGVGKTTTAVTLGVGLAGLGYETLIIDTDPQGNIASFLGQDPGPGFFNLIVGQNLDTVIRPTNQAGLAIVPGNETTVNADTLIRTDNTGQFDQQIILRRLAPFYANGTKKRVIIIDTAPSLSSVQIAALCAGDWLIIPATPEYASETGIAALSSAIAELQEMGAGIRLLGIVPTMVDPRRREHKETLADLRETFPGLIFYPVRNLAAIAEAPRAGESIWSYRPAASEDYAKVLAGVVKYVA